MSKKKVDREKLRKNKEMRAAEKKKRNAVTAIIIGCAVLLAAAISVTAGVIISNRAAEKYIEEAKNDKHCDMSNIKNEIGAYDIRDFKETDEETKYVIIDVKNYGKIALELREDIAPITVANFKKLVDEKFYDGLTFHRIIKDFMIQGGGITTSGGEKKTDTIKGEFSSNGVKNDLLHYRGVISMARTSVKDSATSQFFIMHKTSSHLDGEYAAFGYVLAGMDVVDAIANVTTNASDAPLNQVVINSIRFAYKK